MKYSVNIQAIKSFRTCSEKLGESTATLRKCCCDLAKCIKLNHDLLGPHSGLVLKQLYLIDHSLSDIRILAESIYQVSISYSEIVEDIPSATIQTKKTKLIEEAENEQKRKFGLAWLKRKREIRKAAVEEGKTEEETRQSLEEEFLSLKREYNISE